GDGGGGQLPVGLDQGRVHGGGRADHVVQHGGAARAEHGDVGDAVDAQQVYPVPGLTGERSQQQGRVEGCVQPGRVAEPAGGGAGGVHHDQHVPVAFGTPGAHHHAAASRRGPPVDRAHVVAVDEVAQRIELGALSAL